MPPDGRKDADDTLLILSFVNDDEPESDAVLGY
jgi:hypothetical protein